MLPTVKKILYASDINSGSRPAFRQAISLCGHYDAQITYLHVLEDNSKGNITLQSILKDESMREVYEQSINNLRDKLKKRIEGFCQEELEESEILKEEQMTSIIREGTAWKVIVDVANEIDADVVVMGTRPHSGVGYVLMGSTATKVMHHLKRPILIVPLEK